MAATSAPTAKESQRRPGHENDAVVSQLNKLLEIELSGVTRYLHYSFMVFGANRIPITAWFRDHATEGIADAVALGEKITAYGGNPSVAVRPVPATRHQSLRAMLEESLAFEREALAEYGLLLQMANDDVALEELARKQILTETAHQEEVDKMLRGMPSESSR